MKIHYATLTPGSPNDCDEYCDYTLCGLENTESPMSNKVSEVTCKNCLKQIERSLI
jgi:hypothetical protein